MPQTPRLADVIATLDALYDPGWALSWDAVGLVCGDPAAPVRKVLFAVDPVDVVVDEALAWGADLVVTHHPLFLRAVHGVAATTPKGRVVHRLITAGVALHVAHTNADVAEHGVSEALAARLGLTGTRPLVASPAEPLDKIVTFVPDEAADRVVDALAAAGAGAIGAYTRCAWTTTGTGTFTPQAGAQPAIGVVGQVELVPETRVEMVMARHRRQAVVAALRAAHPYEQPAFDVLELAGWPGPRGIGRVGELATPTRFADLLDHVAARLPLGPAGLRAAGDPDLLVRRVAVCGGAGDDLFDDVRRSGADVYVTADLRHHPAAEALDRGGPALVDAGHWSTEWPWLAEAATRMAAGLAERGATVETRVSTTCTDPWTRHVPPALAPDPGSSS
ncbi:MAG TPA: Nif3-like dinuclear metal center hexameric protein [Actinomycetes bacterium]|nr:Nif3-like dinuclear metal center hexameric protein [Actinomycetes bacterium]